MTPDLACTTTPTLSRQYAKLCDLADFRDPALLAAIRDILPERDPEAHIERKVWEFASLALFLRDVGRLGEDTEALAIGAGSERIVFWLTRHLGRVVATDIYGDGAFSSREAPASMLRDPAAHAPYPYREDRLEVRWMDARKLDFPDASFDVVFSLSSIEHFGSPADISRSAAEMGRVLKPGGYAVVVTDCFARRHPLNAAPVDFAVRLAALGTRRRTATLRRRAVLGEVFTPRELITRIVEPSGLRLLQPLDLSLSPATWATATRIFPDGSLEERPGGHYPLVLLRASRSAFSSVFLPLRKPGG
jgi:SAM-dependent methyltransferase